MVENTWNILFLALSRAHEVVGDPLHAKECRETWDDWLQLWQVSPKFYTTKGGETFVYS